MTERGELRREWFRDAAVRKGAEVITRKRVPEATERGRSGAIAQGAPGRAPGEGHGGAERAVRGGERLGRGEESDDRLDCCRVSDQVAGGGRTLPAFWWAAGAPSLPKAMPLCPFVVRAVWAVARRGIGSLSESANDPAFSARCGGAARLIQWTARARGDRVLMSAASPVSEASTRRTEGNMELCPVCRHRDATCKIRLLRGQTFFSCKSCYDAEERKRPAPGHDPRDPWAEREPKLPRLMDDELLDEVRRR
jgi:hypothetical protein